MGFLPATGFGAGAGAGMLQQIQDAQQRAAEIAQQQELARQHLLLDQQEAQQRGQIQQAQLQSINEQRKQQQDSEATNEALKLQGVLAGTSVDPNDSSLQVLRAGHLAPLIGPQTLDSTNLSGTVGQPLQQLSNPGKMQILRTPQQQDIENRRQQLQGFLQNPDLSPEARLAIQYEQLTGKNAPGGLLKPAGSPAKQYEVTVPGANGQPVRKLVSADDLAAGVPEYKAPQQPPLQLVTYTDPTTGQQVQSFERKQEGKVFDKGPGATTENRLQSARAVVQTGNDIVASLQNPAVAAMLGPVMGRYNSVADFVGAPPPEFAKLAGQIESYALANMGVHGMRSASGADAINQTLGLKRHTPESMIAAIQGLNGFSNHLLENNKQGATSPAAPATTGDLIYAKDTNGIIHSAAKGTPLPAGWVSVAGPKG